MKMSRQRTRTYWLLSRFSFALACISTMVLGGCGFGGLSSDDLELVEQHMRRMHAPNADRGTLQDFQVHDEMMGDMQKVTARIVKEGEEVGTMTVYASVTRKGAGESAEVDGMKGVAGEGGLTVQRFSEPEYEWNPGSSETAANPPAADGKRPLQQQPPAAQWLSPNSLPDPTTVQEPQAIEEDGQPLTGLIDKWAPFPGARPRNVFFHPNGRLLIAIGPHSHFAAWDLEKRQPAYRRFTRHLNFALTQDRTRLMSYTTLREFNYEVWDLETGQLLGANCPDDAPFEEVQAARAEQFQKLVDVKEVDILVFDEGLLLPDGKHLLTYSAMQSGPSSQLLSEHRDGPVHVEIRQQTGGGGGYYKDCYR